MRIARAAAIALLLGASGAFAQAYPAKPIRIVVPFAPGGGTDILTRIMAPKMNEALKQQLIVDNRPGAGSQIGTEIVAKAPPDGYTILMVDTAFMTNPSLYSKLPYNSEKDFAPVSLAATAPVIMIVHPSVPVRTLKELVALARAQPAALNFASGGPGSSTHLGVRAPQVRREDRPRAHPVQGHRARGRRRARRTGDDDVRGHQLGETARRIRKAARDRGHRREALARDAEGADVRRSRDEAGGRELLLGRARAGAHAAGDREQAQRHDGAGPEDADVRDKLVELGFDPIGGSPSEFAALLAKETDKWAKVIKAAGVKLD